MSGLSDQVEVDVFEAGPADRQPGHVAAVAGGQRRRSSAPGSSVLARSPPSSQLTVASAAARPPSVAGVALGHDPAAGDDGQPVGQRLGLVQVVGGEQDRGALGGSCRISAQNCRRACRVEPGRRLVEEQQLGAGRRCRAPRRAGGAGRRTACAPGRRPRSAARPVASPRRVARVGVVAGEVPHHLGRPSARRRRWRPAARCRSGPASRARRCRGRRRAPRPRRRPPAVALQDLHGRGLAGAVRAEQREHLAVLDVEVDAVDAARPPYRLLSPRTVPLMWSCIDRRRRRAAPGTTAGRTAVSTGRWTLGRWGR